MDRPHHHPSSSPRFCPPAVHSPASSLHLLGLGVHARLPRVPGHLRHGQDEQRDPGEEEEDEAAAGTGEGPRVVILDPDGVLALDHPLD